MIRFGGDKTFYVEYWGENYKINIIYDKKIKKPIKKHMFTHTLLRVPENMNDDEIEEYISKKKFKDWVEYESDYFYFVNPEYEAEIEKRNLNLEVQKSKKELRQIINRYVEKYTPVFGKPKQTRIRPLNAWGYCNKNKDILSFDELISFIPEHLIEYIVYHEMTHTYCLNHNPPFYRKLGEVYPNHKQIHKELDLYMYMICKREIYSI